MLRALKVEKRRQVAVSFSSLQANAPQIHRQSHEENDIIMSSFQICFICLSDALEKNYAAKSHMVLLYPVR